MNKLSLAEVHEIPNRKMILFTGLPGSGKSTLCHQIVLNSIAKGRPVILVITERSQYDIADILRDKGLSEAPLDLLCFVDAFSETVGLKIPDRSDTTKASCEDLNSISMSIAKFQRKIGKENILLAFDSLTSPYLFNREEIFRFIRLFLLKFAAEGNAVMAFLDEGCGKEEDLVAMRSMADGIIKLELENSTRVLNIVKHPVLKPTKIEVSSLVDEGVPLEIMDTLITKRYMKLTERSSKKHYEKREGGSHSFFWLRDGESVYRKEVGDYVNLFWANFSFWSGMLWDPKRFTGMIYNLTKELTFQGAQLFMNKMPWPLRSLFKMIPRRIFRPKFMQQGFIHIVEGPFEASGGGIMEYMFEESKADEHYVRLFESSSCWGLENVGVPLCYYKAAYVAGYMKFFDKAERDWNAVETTCMGQGSSFCEFKIAPGEMEELEDYLTAVDSSKIEIIENRLMDQVRGFIKEGKPLGERPTLGSGIHTHEFLWLLTLPALGNERYRMAVRMAGAMAGKRLAEKLVNLGFREDEAIRRMFNLLEYCKVGKVYVDETIRIIENCESYGLEGNKHTCFFTTGFLNGFLSAIKNQHVQETKCVAAGDPYCEWEII